MTQKCIGNGDPLVFLTNATKYIAENYPYNADVPELWGYVDAYREKHTDYPLGASCLGSSRAIVALAESRGLEARVSDPYEADRNNAGHVYAVVKINGKEFAFECGLVGRAPRGWVVYDHETGDGIAYDAWDGTERIGDYRDPQYY